VPGMIGCRGWAGRWRGNERVGRSGAVFSSLGGVVARRRRGQVERDRHMDEVMVRTMTQPSGFLLERVADVEIGDVVESWTWQIACRDGVRTGI